MPYLTRRMREWNKGDEVVKIGRQEKNELRWCEASDQEEPEAEPEGFLMWAVRGQKVTVENVAGVTLSHSGTFVHPP